MTTSKLWQDNNVVLQKNAVALSERQGVHQFDSGV